ncbi:hypothetical protein C6W88_05675 [Halomonas litopenaei]|uniref:BstA-like C-terminal domain-containing protein n=1 Tax=Halomonas litopenaei TaxID=2109328 RepID=A0ABX5J1J2_9GAMM|nr:MULTISPECIES: hypothetical protein [Halomonas]PTL90131.1 hypothetical protein C6W89_14285 [Halomonas sp. SYSU XM8]PTL95563.1 hypothetical protein C6W88_05675 [Halomonas litopenaei]
MGNEVTTGGQYLLDLKVEREVEVDGIGMGVLNNGIAYLNARGLARMCGVDHTMILRLGDQWGTEKEQPRVTRIREYLREQDIELGKPYIATEMDGVMHHAYIDSVCMAILEYYAFDAKQGNNATALKNYRLLARNSLQRFIYEKVGYSPDAGIPVAWQQFHDRVTASYHTVPSGYYSVFKEMADLIVELIRGGADVGVHFIPDISVGKAWSQHWQSSGLSTHYGERVRYDHHYPEYFPQSASNPQPAYCYPETSLHEFRRWMREVYIPAKLPKYLSGKVKQGHLPSSFMESASLIFKK